MAGKCELIENVPEQNLFIIYIISIDALSTIRMRAAACICLIYGIGDFSENQTQQKNMLQIKKKHNNNKGTRAPREHQLAHFCGIFLRLHPPRRI